ncbi:MAG: helix-turn-helix transcriptional regulator [Victivallales bacterium]
MIRRYNWAVILGAMQDNLFMSQDTLADTFHVSQQAVSAWMRGTRYPSYKTGKTMPGFAARHNIDVNHDGRTDAGSKAPEYEQLFCKVAGFVR